MNDEIVLLGNEARQTRQSIASGQHVNFGFAGFGGIEPTCYGEGREQEFLHNLPWGDRGLFLRAQGIDPNHLPNGFTKNGLITRIG